MPRTSVNTQRQREQDDFGLRVKIELLRRGESLSDLARELELSRTTVSLAVNHGLFHPTRQRIAEHLRIPLSP